VSRHADDDDGLFFAGEERRNWIEERWGSDQPVVLARSDTDFACER